MHCYAPYASPFECVIDEFRNPPFYALSHISFSRGSDTRKMLVVNISSRSKRLVKTHGSVPCQCLSSEQQVCSKVANSGAAGSCQRIIRTDSLGASVPVRQAPTCG